MAWGEGSRLWEGAAFRANMLVAKEPSARKKGRPMIALTTSEQAMFDREYTVADKELSAVIENLDDGDDDPLGVLYSLWLQLTHLLADAGWSGEQLASDAQHHAARATCVGGMQ